MNDVGFVARSGRHGRAGSRGPLRTMILALLLAALGLVGLARDAPAAVDLPGQWQTRAPSGTARQEVSYVEAGGKFYLAGGTTTGLHERYDPKSDSWTTVEPLPVPDNKKLDHIQGAELGGKIYYVGGLSGWPGPHVDTMYVYDPATDSFSQGAPMPAGRGRGAGGVAAYNGKIYYAGGMHDGKAVPWFDVYDPKTNSWSRLPDMPRARDHFQAAVVGGKFYAIGGRDSGVSINATTTANDAYDFAAGSWRTGLAPLPTARGGFATAVLGGEILVIGGEGGGKAYNTVEAYDTDTNGWRKLEPMPTARHGTQAAVCNGGVYVAAGGKTQGGGSPTNVHETFFLGAPTACGTPAGDTTPPDTTITAGPSGTVATRAATFYFSSSEANSGFECKLDGGLFGPCSSPKGYGNLADGSHTFQVRASDAAGNADPTPATRSWTVETASPPPPGDTIDPRITGLKPKPNSRVRDRTPRVSATVRDAGSELSRSDIKLYVDGRARAFSYSPSTDRLSHASKRLSYGRHTVRIVATDGAGNRAAKAWAFKVVNRRR